MRRALTLLAGLLVFKVTIAVMLGYVDYFPPNFNSDFLRGRQSYFGGSYRWAFYPHIVSGPIALILGTIQISDRFRLRFPKWHRYLGRIHVLCVLGLVTPSGLWMAWWAAPGPIAGLAFATLAILTGTCVAQGWRSAVRRRFADHRRWMWRGYLLLCSAVVLRLAGGLATVIGIGADWFDPLASWASWLVPLSIFELQAMRTGHRPPSLAK